MTIIPKSLPYPRICNLTEVPELKGQYCYIIKNYPLSGTAIMIFRDDDNVHLRFTDFKGVVIKPYKDLLVIRLINLMRAVHIKQGIFYLSEGNLVDVRLSLNKFCSPGFIKDIFGKVEMPIQECVGKPVQLDEDNMKKILDGEGEYACSIIIKPSTFKSIIRGDEVLPMYGARHEIKQPS